jgi:hypothetical protein
MTIGQLLAPMPPRPASRPQDSRNSAGGGGVDTDRPKNTAFSGAGDVLYRPMTKQPRSPPGDPTPLGNMRANGVRSFDVCWSQCHHRTILSADPWPDFVPVPSFGPRMLCTRCGIIRADARPNWQEQPARETLTGVQWR